MNATNPNKQRISRAALLLAGGLGIGIAATMPRSAVSQESTVPPKPTPPANVKNVLFIAVDDLRPTFGAYGGPIKTPNIDRLAGRGTTFLRAYCQQAVCSPSRTSLLTGQRPDTTKVWDLVTHFRDTIPNTVTLPQYFKNAGYHVEGMGKIYHGGYDDTMSWDVPHWNPKGAQYTAAGNAIRKQRREAALAEGVPQPQAQKRQGPAYESGNVRDEFYNDGLIAKHAIEALQQRKTAGKPFFLAVGFQKPHLPFVSPKKYWDMYKPSDIVLPPNFNKRPENEIPIASNGVGELGAYANMPKQKDKVDETTAKTLMHGYYAAASYMDAQVGRVLDELERTGLAKNTVVVLWGDHGWSLGSHGNWCKHTNFEIATHAPLILHVPGQKQVGGKVKNLAEFVDVYPTLSEAAGLPIPSGLAGKSLVASTNDVSAPTKPFAISQYPRGGGAGAGSGALAAGRRIMGYTMRTDKYRYTEWEKNGAELYDHEKDPNEMVNIAAKSENHKIVANLSKQLHDAIPGAKAEMERAKAKAEPKTL